MKYARRSTNTNKLFDASPIVHVRLIGKRLQMIEMEFTGRNSLDIFDFLYT